MEHTHKAILEKWVREAEREERAHSREGPRNQHWHYWIGVPLIICSACAGAGQFPILEQEFGVVVKVVAAIASFITVGLATFQTFLGSAGRAEGHRVASADYASIRRDVDHMLCHPESEEDCKLIEARLNQARKSAPNIPKWV